MLKPAILYKEQITRRFREYYYTEDLFYESGDMDNWTPEIAENPQAWNRQYAIVDNDDNLIGYLSYAINWYSDEVSRFSLFSFDRGNSIIGFDLLTELERLVNKHRRIEWRMVGGNPVERHYDKFCERHNGNKHILKQAIRDSNGNYRDYMIYEILNQTEILRRSK